MLITHQMEVVKEICHKVAVMEKGRIIEQGNIVSVFSNPQSEITKDFVSSLFQDEKIFELLAERAPLEELSHLEKLVKISFVGQQTGHAFISKLSKQFGCRTRSGRASSGRPGEETRHRTPWPRGRRQSSPLRCERGVLTST